MAKQFTLGKSERLKSRKEIQQLFSEGKKLPSSPFRIHYVVLPAGNRAMPNLQFGAGVSSKTFKGAVDRNRIKRLTREAYRLQKKQLQDALMEKKLRLNVFFIYTGKEVPAFGAVKEKVNVILNKLTKIVNEINSPDT